MTECQGCGAWNESHRTLCVLCGTPLAETDEWDASAELPPLPPLPDGGLATTMPSWLRDVPAIARATPAQPPEPALLGPQADPRTFLTDEDFPSWLRDLAARESRPAALDPRTIPEPGSALLVGRAGWPNWPAAATPSPTPPPLASEHLVAPAASETPPFAAASDGEPIAATSDRPPPAVVAARPVEPHRGRATWETLLLALLFLGVVVAAVWALVANGLFGPGI